MILDAARYKTMDILSLLSKSLADINNRGGVEMRTCAEMDKVLVQLEKQVRKGGTSEEPKDMQEEAVRRFWKSGEFESLRDARLVCFGLTVRPWGDSRCLIEDPDRFDWVLDGLREWEDSPRQYRKCYQGLVRSYFDYDGMGRSVHITGGKNWRTLQSYLNNKAPLIRDANINPDWVGCVLGNRELFTTDPCAAYAPKVMSGRTDEVSQVRELLGITDASWFTRELILAQLSHACKQSHLEFSSLLSSLLKLINGNEVLRDRGLRMLLDRYARIPQAPQHVELKEFSVNSWGNPWLPSNDHRWGGVTDEAREMIGNWLKLEFIELFFTKLAQDGLSDTRRLKFWVRYVPLIENIHFALGSHAMNSRERDFIELRSKLKGLIVNLEDNKPLNNAFIMTMGDLVAVEFSGESNAFYGYSLKRALPFDLTKPVRSAPVNGRNSLKNDARILYLRHQDNVSGYPHWEDRFKDELRDNFGISTNAASTKKVAQSNASTSPKAPSAATAFQNKTSSSRNEEKLPHHLLSILKSRRFNQSDFDVLARQMSIQTEDRRPIGGGLWFIYHGSDASVCDLLRYWDFRYIGNKGWVRFS